jgi:hypothetical protein
MTVLRALVPLLAATLAAAPARAEEALFADGFEAGDLCPWSATGAAALAESEPNDVPAQADALGRCGAVEGTIGAVQAGEADFDYFRLTLGGPALVRITLGERDGASDFVPYADVDDLAQQYPPLGLTPTAAAATTRQLWLPAAGDWYLFVADERNWDRANAVPVETPAAGGASGTYRLEVAWQADAAQPLFFPLSAEPLEIGADGALVAFRIGAGATPSLDLVEVFAARLAEPSALDAKLYVVREAAAGRTTVAACDDQTDGGDCDTGIDNVDPKLEAVELVADPYLVLVDFYDVEDALPQPFELDLQYLSASP